jgi:hypothetical protein
VDSRTNPARIRLKNDLIALIQAGLIAVMNDGSPLDSPPRYSITADAAALLAANKIQEEGRTRMSG